ncbi:MAG: hypothetical protein ACOX3T_01665 [Bdellovibrionota bacterium]
MKKVKIVNRGAQAKSLKRVKNNIKEFIEKHRKSYGLDAYEFLFYLILERYLSHKTKLNEEGLKSCIRIYQNKERFVLSACGSLGYDKNNPITKLCLENVARRELKLDKKAIETFINRQSQEQSSKN